MVGTVRSGELSSGALHNLYDLAFFTTFATSAHAHCNRITFHGGAGIRSRNEDILHGHQLATWLRSNETETSGRLAKRAARQLGIPGHSFRREYQMVGGVGQLAFQHQTLNRLANLCIVIRWQTQCAMDSLRLYRLVLGVIDEIEDLLGESRIVFGVKTWFCHAEDRIGQEKLGN